MTLIDWRDEFRTGITAVDFEHESLIKLLNELYANLGADAPKDDVEDFLGEVHAQIAAHFALEEKMMRDAAYDQFSDHKSDHDRLLDEIRDIMDRFAAEGYEGYGDDLAAHLRAWFVDHFKTKDSRLHNMLG
jgi:hemerythrin-like metal-binding protein